MHSSSKSQRDDSEMRERKRGRRELLFQVQESSLIYLLWWSEISHIEEGKRKFREGQSSYHQEKHIQVLRALKQKEIERRTKKIHFFCMNQKSGQALKCSVVEALEVFLPREGLKTD